MTENSKEWIKNHKNNRIKKKVSTQNKKKNKNLNTINKIKILYE